MAPIQRRRLRKDPVKTKQFSAPPTNMKYMVQKKYVKKLQNRDRQAKFRSSAKNKAPLAKKKKEDAVASNEKVKSTATKKTTKDNPAK